METIIKKGNYHTQYDANTKIVHSAYPDLINVADAIEVFDAILEFSKKNKIKAMLTDLSKTKGTFTMLNDAIVTKYYPPLIAQGLVCNGMIVSQDVFTKFAINNLMQKMGSFTIKNFNDSKECYSWILEEIAKPES